MKFAVPLGPVGVPLIVPDEPIASPAGSVPALIENAQVPAPPLSATAWLYAMPSVPAGRDVVVIFGIAEMFTVTDAVFVLSFTDVAVITAAPVTPFALYVTDEAEALLNAPGPLVNAQETPELPES